MPAFSSMPQLDPVGDTERDRLLCREPGLVAHQRLDLDVVAA
jgi:hypothetical protein